MRFFYFILLYVPNWLSFIDAHKQRNELINNRLTNYSKIISPNDTVEIDLGISLFKIIQIDEIKEIMQSSAYLTVSWNDNRLKWDQNEYNNITHIYMPYSLLWKPDFNIINSADSSGYIKFSETTLAIIDCLGTVLLNIELPSN